MGVVSHDYSHRGKRMSRSASGWPGHHSGFVIPFGPQENVRHTFLGEVTPDDLIRRLEASGSAYGLEEDLSDLPLGGDAFSMGIVQTHPDQSQEQLKSRGRAGQAELEKKLATLVDISLDIRKLLAEVLEVPQRGVGAIHTLNEGKVRLVQPVMYSSQDFGDEVLVGIEEVGVYGVGVTEREAVLELQQELWALHQDLEKIPEQELGSELRSEKRILRGWIGNALDA